MNSTMPDAPLPPVPASPRSPSPHGLYGLVIARPVGVLMAVLSVTVFGLIAFDRLPVNLMPDISYPRLTVRTEFPGAAPEEVENLVARPLEEGLGVLSGLVNVSSLSRAGTCDIVLEFAWATRMNSAAQEVREKLDQVTLPKEAGRPLLLRYDPALDPVVRLGLYGPMDLRALRRLADGDLKRALETIPGVAAARVKGGYEEEVRVALEERALAAHRLSITAIRDRLAQENVNLASGSLREGQTEYLVRTLNEFRTVEEIEGLVVSRSGGAEVRIRDLGRVFVARKRREVATRLNGAESVELDLYKEADANLVSVADAVRRRVLGGSPSLLTRAMASAMRASGGAKPAAGGSGGAGSGAPGQPLAQEPTERPLAETLPAGCRLELLSDQSTFVRNAISDVEGTAASGGLLAVVILLPFLRRVRDTLLIGLSIPLSIVATFGMLHLFHVSLNVMSLGGLALGVGMLVDGSIVVLESIERRRAGGEPAAVAAELGTREVGLAVSASTLTTVAVFLPIVFVEGVAGQIFRDQAITVVFSLLASLVVATLVVPVLAARELTLSSAGERWTGSLRRWESLGHLAAAWRGRGAGYGWRRVLSATGLAWGVARFPIALAWDLILFIFVLVFGGLLVCAKALLGGSGVVLRVVTLPLAWVTDRALAVTHAFYPAVIRGAWRGRAVLLLASLGALAWSFTLLPKLGRQLLPEVHEGEFTLHLALPVGSPLGDTEALVRRVEEAVLASERRVEILATTIGAEQDSDRPGEEGEHTARMTFRLRGGGGENAARVEEEVRGRARSIVAGIPGVVSMEFSRPVLFTFRTPVEVEVRGHRLEDLKRLSREVAAAMSGVEGLADVKVSLGEGNPEVQVVYDRVRLSRAQLSVAEAAAAVKNKVEGDVATRISERDRRVDVRVKTREEDASSLEALANLQVTPAGGGRPMPLSSVADVRKEEGPSEIRRVGHQRTVRVTADLAGFDLAGAIDRIEARLRAIPRPADCAFLVSGQSKEMEVSLASLRIALALAAFLVYVVMASQFESLLQPLLILASLPMAVVGVLPTLYLTATPISVLVLIGVIVLAGVVVNNAIVLVDAVNQLRAAGRPPMEAVVEAGRTRIRPILMTTLTTVLGLAPMALSLGEGAEVQRPLALTLIAGLASSTVLTLVLVPVLCLMAERGWREDRAAGADGAGAGVGARSSR